MAEKGFKHKLTSILNSDAVVDSRPIGEDEGATFRTLTANNELLSTLIKKNNDKVVDSPGDSLLAIFISVVDTVQCAVAFQKKPKARIDELPEIRRVVFRIDLKLRDVI